MQRPYETAYRKTFMFLKASIQFSDRQAIADSLDPDQTAPLTVTGAI